MHIALTRPGGPSVPLIVAVFAVFALAAWLRLSGTAWDEFAGLHPDERHMIFVVSDMLAGLASAGAEGLSWPDLWFDAGVSPLNPHSGDRVYVYGEAPALALTLLARALGGGGWVWLLEQGRSLSAVIDSLTVLAVIILSFSLTRTAAVALLAGVLYAAAPTAQQLANFFTPDVYLTAGAAWSAVALAALAQAGRLSRAWPLALMTGAAIGLAMACKITGGFLVVPVLAVLGRVVVIGRARCAAVSLICIPLAAFVVFRLANPFAFAGPGPLGIAVSPAFVEDFRSLLTWTASPDFPPNWSWIAGYSWLDFLRDFAVFGCGPVSVALLLGGIRLARPGFGPVLLACVMLPPLIFAVTHATPFLRYAAPAIPALSVLAARAAGAWPGAVKLLAAIVAIWWGSGAYVLHQPPHPRLDDSWAQESWRVYDHPTVRIYERQPCFGAEHQRLLLQAFDPPSDG